MNDRDMRDCQAVRITLVNHRRRTLAGAAETQEAFRCI